ncbi:MAG: NAD-binding protein [Clostridiales bacterium]|nr:NAD-binding protein [Clostridiales bacterium]
MSLELSENLNKLGIDVYILEKEDVLIPRFDKDISMEIENIVSEFVTVIKEGKILKVRENTELYRGRNRDVLEVEYSIRK